MGPLAFLATRAKSLKFMAIQWRVVWQIPRQREPNPEYLASNCLFLALYCKGFFAIERLSGLIISLRYQHSNYSPVTISIVRLYNRAEFLTRPLLDELVGWARPLEALQIGTKVKHGRAGRSKSHYVGKYLGVTSIGKGTSSLSCNYRAISTPKKRR